MVSFFLYLVFITMAGERRIKMGLDKNLGVGDPPLTTSRSLLKQMFLFSLPIRYQVWCILGMHEHFVIRLRGQIFVGSVIKNYNPATHIFTTTDHKNKQINYIIYETKWIWEAENHKKKGSLQND